MLPHLAAVHQRVRYGKLVDILQLITKAYAACDGCNLNIGKGLEAVSKVEERGLTLDRGRYGDDDLLNLAREELIGKKVYLQIGWSDTLHGRYDTTQDVIYAVVLPSILYGHQILHLLNNTYRRAIAALIATYRADIVIRQVITAATVAHIVPKATNTLCEGVHMFTLHLEHMHRQAQRRTTANAW